jgi:peptide/nickel transport system permease protein
MSWHSEALSGGKVAANPSWLVLALSDANFVIGAVLILVFVVCAVLAGTLSPYDPVAVDAAVATVPPSTAHWLGTDEFGRDILSRVVWGSRASLTVAIGAAVLSALAGVPLGLLAGYFGGWLDVIIMRVLDAVLAFPLILLAILITAALGTSPLTLMGAIGFLYIPYYGRLVRGSVLGMRNEVFVQASVASGSPTWRILWQVFLPNVAAPILVQATLAMGVSLLIEAGLSYLGLGVQPPTPAWGSMLRVAQSYLYNAPWYVLSPGVCIFLAVLGFNLVSDGLRDVLDPRMRR